MQVRAKESNNCTPGCQGFRVQRTRVRTRNVKVHQSVSRDGTIRRGDPVVGWPQAQALTNRATEAMKPRKKFFPPDRADLPGRS